MTPAMISAAVLMVTLGAAITLWFRGDLAAGSARRRARMMSRSGLDYATLGHSDVQSALKAARRRCNKCPREDLCERWLAGTVPGQNVFCPNAQTFRAFASRGTTAA